MTVYMYLIFFLFNMDPAKAGIKEKCRWKFPVFITLFIFNFYRAYLSSRLAKRRGTDESSRVVRRRFMNENPRTCRVHVAAS